MRLNFFSKIPFDFISLIYDEYFRIFNFRGISIERTQRKIIFSPERKEHFRLYLYFRPVTCIASQLYFSQYLIFEEKVKNYN